MQQQTVTQQVEQLFTPFDKALDNLIEQMNQYLIEISATENRDTEVRQKKLEAYNKYRSNKAKS